MTRLEEIPEEVRKAAVDAAMKSIASAFDRAGNEIIASMAAQRAALEEAMRHVIRWAVIDPLKKQLEAKNVEA